MYVARQCTDKHARADRQFTESKPCANCTEMLKKYGVRRVVYTTREDALRREKVRDIRTDHVSIAYRDLKRQRVL